MTANVQGSASTIGMAPITTTPATTLSASAQGMAPTAQSGGLPSLTQQMGATTGQIATQDPTTAGMTSPTTPGQAFDITKLASKGRWLGPLMAVGGGIAAIAAYSKGQDGSKFLKFGGITTALSGLALTGVGFKAKGIEVGSQQTATVAQQMMQQREQEYAASMEQLKATSDAQVASLEQQVAMGQLGPGTDPAAIPGADTTGGAASIPGMPAEGADLGDATSSVPVGPGLAMAVVPTNDAFANVQASPDAAGWSVTSLVGKAVSLQAGTSPSGAAIADAGQFRIEQPAGDPNGYATLAEANDAARQSMSTELAGSKYLRWMVVEHGGRFYGAIAKQLEAGGQAAPLDAQTGTVAAWSALNHVSETGGAAGFQAYTWNATEGAQSKPVEYGTTQVFPAGSSTTAPVTGGGATSTGRVPATAPANSFQPASQVGRSFAINASVTAEGDNVRGGALQLQRFVDASAGGFGTAEEAATVARAARAAAGDGSQWSRWVSLQGSDGKFYVYEGSIVARDTAALENAAPMHVFAHGFAEYFDGATNAWTAVRDSGA